VLTLKRQIAVYIFPWETTTLGNMAVWLSLSRLTHSHATKKAFAVELVNNGCVMKESAAYYGSE
jgi:hypothetical protein